METPSGVVIRDLNTTNGTYVNFDRVGSCEHSLKSGDRIRLAGSEVVIVYLQEGYNTVKMDTPPAFAGEAVSSSRKASATEDAGESLAPKDTALLKYLESRRSEVVSREDIVKRVWPELPAGVNTELLVSESVNRVRAKLGDDPAKPTHIITVGEFGYLFI
ncbi:MAG: FHA domain-containing protein [SAR202 cluster bacterium]|nr:FHA domain-containing protein [SAR202 cluster bacterium]